MGVLKVRAGQIDLFRNHPGKTENGFVDNNDASILAFSKVNGATSYLKISNGDSTPTAPKIAVDGTDSNQGLRIETKGTGSLEIVEAGNSNPGSIKLFDNDSSHSVEVKAAATIGTSFTLTLPTDDGGANDFLQTDGSGVLSFAPVAAAAVTALNDASENELVTIGSTTTELDAESTLTYDGSILKLQGELRVQSDANNYGSLTTGADGSLTIKAVDADSASDYTQEAHIFLDAEGQIFLNSAAGDFIYSKGGEIGGLSESFLRISRDFSSLDAIIEQTVVDKDIIIRGNDGGTGIDMLKLDASAAGDATFSGSVTTGNSTLTGSKLINTGAFELDGSNDITIDSNTGNIIFAKGGAAAGKFTVSPNSKNFKLDFDATNHVTTTVAANGATTVATVDSDGTDGHYILDINGDIELDSDSGNVTIAKNSAAGGKFLFDSTAKTFRMQQTANDHVTTTVAANGATTVATVDNAAAAGHYTLDIDGDVILDPHSGKTILKKQGTQYGELTDNGGNNLIIKSGSTTAVTFTGANAVFAGNITVQGTTTRVDSTVVTIEDPVIVLGDSAGDIGADDNKDRGIQFKYYDGSAKFGFFGYDDSTGRFAYRPVASEPSDGVFDGAFGGADFGDVTLTNATGTQQLRLKYNDTNYADFSVNDQGTLTIKAVDADSASDYTQEAHIFLDAEGEITLDSAAGIWNFDSGALGKRLEIRDANGDITFENFTQDKDITFTGNDGGTIVNALSLDMSAGGAATFSNSVTIGTAITTGSASDNHAVRKSDLVSANLKKHGEISATTPNGSTFNFDFAATAASGSHVSLFLNGIRQRIDDADGNDGASNSLIGNKYKDAAGADGSGSNFTLSTNAIATNDHYNGMIIVVLDNAGGGDQQGKFGFITDYNGTSKVAVVSGGTLNVANVDGGDNYQIYRFDGLAKKTGGGSNVLRVEFAIPPASDDTIMADYLVD
tara:strand:- start:51 stop:2921 length:2871 start_codon:yes stop_codon:yes gene_type:complete